MRRRLSLSASSWAAVTLSEASVAAKAAFCMEWEEGAVVQRIRVTRVLGWMDQPRITASVTMPSRAQVPSSLPGRPAMEPRLHMSVLTEGARMVPRKVGSVTAARNAGSEAATAATRVVSPARSAAFATVV